LVSAEAAEHSTEFSLDANCSEFCRELQADSDAALSNDTSDELGVDSIYSFRPSFTNTIMGHFLIYRPISLRVSTS
jgi:hypothetical protein